MCAKFQLSISNSFRDMRGSQFYTRGRCTPRPLLAEKFLYPKSVRDPAYMCVKFQFCSSNTFRDMRGPKIHDGESNFHSN